jgi:branched-chain amino acid transport system permease protein
MGDAVFQVLLNGLIAGMAIGVLALAFTVVSLPTRVFHIALGGIYGLAPFIAWQALRWEMPWYVAIGTALLVALLVSLGCEKANHGPLARRGASVSAHLVSSLGIHILLVQTAALTWGNSPKVLRVGLDPVYRLGTIVLTQSQLISAAVALSLVALFFVWLRLSHVGLQFRAMADNPIELALWGYNLDRLRLVAFLIAGSLACGASLPRAFDIGFDPHMGLHAFLLAVVATIIGGRRSFVGPVVAGVLLGLARSSVVWFLSARWQEAVTFALLAGFLLLRPQGLFGRRARLEAEA